MQVITNPIKLRRDSGSGKLKSNADTRPDPFYFTAQTDVSLDTLILSNTVTISGLGAAAIIKIIGGEYLIDGGSWTSAQGTISNGQTLQARVNSSIDFSEPTTATVNVGGFSAAFTVTTQAEVSPGTLIGYADWSDGNITPPSGGYGGADWNTFFGGATVASVIDGVLHVDNPLSIAENDSLVAFGHPDISDHVYVEWRWRYVSANALKRHGMKHFKVHGVVDAGYANTTVGLEGDTAEASRISFGDGTQVANDTGYILRYDTPSEDVDPEGAAAQKELTGRNFTAPGVILDTPQHRIITGDEWGTDFHVSRYLIKYNSGTTAENEVNDGAFKVIHDSLTFIDMQNIFNKHYTNKKIDYLSWLDVSQGGVEAGGAGYIMEIDYIKVSLNGFVD